MAAVVAGSGGCITSSSSSSLFPRNFSAFESFGFTIFLALRLRITNHVLMTVVGGGGGGGRGGG